MCFPGDEEYLRDLEACQPGNNGGKLRSRFEKRACPRDEDHAVLRNVLSDLVEVMLIKARAGKMSERSVDEDLASRAAGYRRNGLDSVADAFPTSYKALLTMLQESGKGLQPAA